MPAHHLQTAVSYQKVDLDEPLQKTFLIGLRVEGDGDKTSKRRWLGVQLRRLECTFITMPEHIQAALGNAQESKEKQGKETSRQGTVLYNTITQLGVNSISDQKSKSTCRELAMLRQQINFTCLILRDQGQVQEKSAHEDNIHKAPCSIRPSFLPALANVSHFS